MEYCMLFESVAEPRIHSGALQQEQHIASTPAMHEDYLEDGLLAERKEVQSLALFGHMPRTSSQAAWSCILPNNLTSGQLKRNKFPVMP